MQHSRQLQEERAVTLVALDEAESRVRELLHQVHRREGCRESRGCSRDTYPESYITRYTSVRGNSAHIRQAGPNSGPGFRVKVFNTFQAVPSLLGSG
jgi:hypothetical protein